jgi:L-ribulokinase
MMEATAFGLRWICDTLKDAGVPARRFVASGGLPAKSPLLMQIYADVLGAPISQSSGEEPVALGAAILGCAAAGEAATGYAGIEAIIREMVPARDQLVYQPDAEAHRAYDALYRMYRAVGAVDGTVADVMRRLRKNSL